MLSEFNVRAEASHVEALEVRPMRKARMLLAIAKKVKLAARRLTLLSQYHYREGNVLIAARFREAAQRLCNVHEDVRDRAVLALRPASRSLGYGYAPRDKAYPAWKLCDAAVVAEEGR